MKIADQLIFLQGITFLSGKIFIIKDCRGFIQFLDVLRKCAWLTLLSILTFTVFIVLAEWTATNHIYAMQFPLLLILGKIKPFIHMAVLTTDLM